jgi:methyl-accepting chemotaxis protein
MTGQKKLTYRRRIIYIEKHFQRNFIVRFCLVALISMAAASTLLYFLSGDSVTASYRSSHLVLEKTSDAIIGKLLITNLTVLVAFVITTVFVTLYVSFKIGGPLYRFSQDLNYIAQGNLKKRVKLRKADQLQKFAGDINYMVENIEIRVREIQTQISGLREVVEEVEFDRDKVARQASDLHDAANTLFDTKD